MRVEFVDDGEPFDPTGAPAKRISGPTADFQIGGYGAGLAAEILTAYELSPRRRPATASSSNSTPSAATAAELHAQDDMNEFDPELRAAIRATSAFRDLSEADLAFLIEAAELRTFDPGAILMVQGEPSDCAMLILAGEVTVTADSARGAIPGFHAARRPALVGELGVACAIARAPRPRARARP